MDAKVCHGNMYDVKELIWFTLRCTVVLLRGHNVYYPRLGNVTLIDAFAMIVNPFISSYVRQLLRVLDIGSGE
jgi:hypothetical protein